MKCPATPIRCEAGTHVGYTRIQYHCVKILIGSCLVLRCVGYEGVCTRVRGSKPSDCNVPSIDDHPDFTNESVALY